MMTRNSQAFSMMEIMVVLFIIGLLATFGGPKIMRFFAAGKEKATQTYLNEIVGAVQMYEMHIGHYPKKDEGGLRALVDRPSNQNIAAKWDGPYLEEEKLEDKWGNEFIYNCPPERHRDRYRYFEVISFGETGEEGGKEFHAGG